MLRELGKIIDDNEEKGISEVELTAAAASLRKHQFIWKDKRNQARTYDLIVKFQGYFSSLFEAFGDTFFVDHHFGYCGILPQSNSPSLKLRETIFLLILAKLHDTESRRACTENGRSTPNEGILLDEYVELTERERPSKTETKEALDRLARYGVIELGAFNEETELRSITILPSIMRVVNANFMDELTLFASGENQEETQGDEEVEDSESSEDTEEAGDE